MCPEKPIGAITDSNYEPSISCARKKKADCIRLGPFFRNDTESRRNREPYVFRYDSPFVCPQTFRLLHANIPHLLFARHVRAAGLSLDLPRWTHSQLPEYRADAVYNAKHYPPELQNAMFAKWAPNFTTAKPHDDDFWCAVYRMEWLDHFRASLEQPDGDCKGLPRDALLQVALLQDMNQMRLLLMDTHGVYTREECIRIVGEDAYATQYGTTLASVMHCGLIPDMACIHANLPFWDKPTETFARMSVPFEHDEVAWTLIRMFTKVIFQPSKMRELNKCIRDEIVRMEQRHHAEIAKASQPPRAGAQHTRPRVIVPESVRFMMILVRLIFCSLAGFYPHSVYLPSALFRRELYRRYMFDVPTLTEFKVWIMHNKRLMTMVLRENHIYNLGILPGVESVFRELYEYDKIRSKTLNALEVVRSTIDDGLHVLEARLRGDVCPIATKPCMLRKAYVNHLLLECATLSNIGEMLSAFSNRYGGEFVDIDLRECTRKLFWQCTMAGDASSILSSFSVSIPYDVAECNLRTVVLYWLILQDRCVDQSGKKTREKFAQCKQTLNNTTRTLLPEMPSRKKTVSNTSTSRKRKRAMDMRDHTLIMDANRAQNVITDSFTCPRHSSATSPSVGRMDCMCLVDIIKTCVRSFDIYRLLQPVAWCEQRVAVDKGIEQYLWTMYDACLGWCYRPRQTSFAEEITNSATSVCNIFGSVGSLKSHVKYPPLKVDPKMRSTPAYKIWLAKWQLDFTQRTFDRFHETHREYKKTRDEMREKIENVVYSLPPDACVGIEWLISNFKVSINPVIDIDDAYTMMMEESNHHHPHNAMMRIAQTYPRDFWIIRLLFKVRHRRESIRVYPLWSDITKQQIQSLHAQYNVVRAGDVLPQTMGNVYYCPYHKRILSPIVGADVPKRGYINTRSVGIENIEVNPFTNEKFCYVRTGRIERRCVEGELDDCNDGDNVDDDIATTLANLPRKVRRLFSPEEDLQKMHEDDDDSCDSDNVTCANDQPNADTLRKLQRSSDDDEDDEEEEDDNEVDEDNEDSVDAPKRVLGASAKDGKSTAPVLSARKRRTKKSRFGRCTREPAKVVNMIGKVFMMYKKLYMLCPYCGHVMHYGRDKCTEIGMWCGACTRGEKAMAEKLGIPWDSTNNCADPMHISKSIMGVSVWKKKQPVCLFCGRGPTGQKHLKYHLVYNDLYANRPIGICYIPLCDQDSKWWIGRSVDAMRLSNIFFNLRAMADTEHNNGEVWKVVPRTIQGEQGESPTLIFAVLFGNILQDEQQTDDLIANYKQRERAKGRKRKKALSHTADEKSHRRSKATAKTKAKADSGGKERSKGKGKLHD